MMEEAEKKSYCKGHHHISETSKTAGTPYVKAYCPTCKSWVYTDKNFCVCCLKRVKHKTHNLKAKRIYNKALRDNEDCLSLYHSNGREVPGKMLCPVEFQGVDYHIPIEKLVLYEENNYNRQTMAELQDALQVVRKKKTIN